MNKENEQLLKSLKRYFINNYNEDLDDCICDGKNVSKFEDIPSDYIYFSLNGRFEDVEVIINENHSEIHRSWKRYDEVFKLKGDLK